MKIFEKTPRIETILLTLYSHAKICSLNFPKVLRVTIFENVSGRASLELVSESAHAMHVYFIFKSVTISVNNLQLITAIGNN